MLSMSTVGLSRKIADAKARLRDQQAAIAKIQSDLAELHEKQPREEMSAPNQRILALAEAMLTSAMSAEKAAEASLAYYNLCLRQRDRSRLSWAITAGAAAAFVANFNG